MKLRLHTILTLLLTSSVSIAQTITKQTNFPVSGAICPATGTGYEVSVPTGFTACQIDWTATNGIATRDPNNQRKVSVQWNDTPRATGTIAATFSNCTGNEDNNNKTASFSELILSVKDQEWEFYDNSVDIDYCIKETVVLSVPRMFVQGTGGVAQPRSTEVAYAWTLPSGWREVGTGRTGFFGTSTNIISIEPIECSVPGLVTVYGTLVGAGPFCNQAAKSKTANIFLKGATPTLV